MVYTLIDNDIRYHSDQNVVDSRGAAAVDFFYLSIEGNWNDSFSASHPCLRSDKGIAWHADASSFVCTLIDNGKLTNQIATLLQIVIIFFSLRIRGEEKLAFHQIVLNDWELVIFSILGKASSFHHFVVAQIDGHISFLFL